MLWSCLKTWGLRLNLWLLMQQCLSLMPVRESDYPHLRLMIEMIKADVLQHVEGRTEAVTL